MLFAKIYNTIYYWSNWWKLLQPVSAYMVTIFGLFHQIIALWCKLFMKLIAEHLRHSSVTTKIYSKHFKLNGDIGWGVVKYTGFEQKARNPVIYERLTSIMLEWFKHPCRPQQSFKPNVTKLK